MRTYIDVRDEILIKLQDAGIDPSGTASQVFSEDEVENEIEPSVNIVSPAKPWEYKLTKTATASKDITLTRGDKWKLLKVLKAEYQVDQDPRDFRNVSRFADTLTLKIDTTPTAGNSIYLYMLKNHILLKSVGTEDLAGAVKTLAAAGAVSLALKSLGTGKINEGTSFTIAGDDTTYYVIATANISSNEATVSIWPPLSAEASVDAVVTLSLTESTIQEPRLEDCLIRLVAARCAISKATKGYSQVNQSITSLSNAETAVAAVAAMITQMNTDIGSGRTEAAKVSAILDTANTEIDKILARLTQAATDISAGRTEADKIPAIITASASAIADVAARVTQAVTDLTSARTAVGLGVTAITGMDARVTQSLTDLSSARTAIALGVTAIDLGKTEAGLTNAEIDKAVTALTSASSLLNTVPIGGGAADYQRQAQADVYTGLGFGANAKNYEGNAQADFQNSNADVNLANGEINAGMAKAKEADSNFQNASADLNLANGEINAGMAKIREAQAKLEQAKAEGAANQVFIEQCVAQLRLAQGYFQEAQGYVMESNARLATNSGFLAIANGQARQAQTKIQEGNASLQIISSRLQVSSAARAYENWGRTEMADVKRELLVIGGLPSSQKYPQD